MYGRYVRYCLFSNELELKTLNMQQKPAPVALSVRECASAVTKYVTVSRTAQMAVMSSRVPSGRKGCAIWINSRAPAFQRGVSPLPKHVMASMTAPMDLMKVLAVSRHMSDIINILVLSYATGGPFYTHWSLILLWILLNAAYHLLVPQGPP